MCANSSLNKVVKKWTETFALCFPSAEIINWAEQKRERAWHFENQTLSCQCPGHCVNAPTGSAGARSSDQCFPCEWLEQQGPGRSFGEYFIRKERPLCGLRGRERERNRPSTAAARSSVNGSFKTRFNMRWWCCCCCLIFFFFFLLKRASQNETGFVLRVWMLKLGVLNVGGENYRERLQKESHQLRSGSF